MKSCGAPPFPRQFDALLALCYLRGIIEPKVQVPNVCSVQEGVNPHSHCLWECDTVESNGDVIVVTEDGGASVPGLATLSIMSKHRKEHFPSALRAQGGIFMLRTEWCEQLYFFAGEAGLANGNRKSVEMLVV